MKKILVTQSLLPNRKVFDNYVDQIFESGWLTNNGLLVQQLENQLEDYLGVRHVVCVANGTLALQVAYKALELIGEVITTPFSFIATSSSAVWEGLDVVYADISSDSFNINVAEIEKNITDRTSAILPVHVFGNPCDVIAIEKLANKHGLRVIYDAAHAFAVKSQNESILNWGDISTLSFHATKLFHTIEGGALIINDDDLYERVKSMINFGVAGPELIERLGINAKMNEFEAAMGLSILDKIDSAIERRGKLIGIYDSILKNHIQRQQWMVGATNNHHYYPVLFSDEKTTLKVLSALNDCDIYPRRYFGPSLDALDFLSAGEEMPVSRKIVSRILCLPLLADLSDEDCHRIGEIVLEAMGES